VAAALAQQYAAPMLGGVVELELPCDGARLFGRKRRVERRRLMRIQVVEHDANDLGVGIGATMCRMQCAKSILVRRSMTNTSRQPRFGSQIIIRSRTPLRWYSVS
jgi:hypothetical protein